MRNVQKISAVALGMLAGFAINKYATAQNFVKLKGKIKETYDDLSKKFEEATEPKVEYVDDEIFVDKELLDSCERMDPIYDEENDISVNTGSIMDAYMKWNENADVLRFTTEELQELAPHTRRDVHAALADLYDKLDDDYFVSVATLMQVIWDIEKDDLRGGISFKDRFPLMTKNYDEDTLINYGWEDDDDAFCSDVTPDSDFYVIIKQSPHNITSLVEEWTKENRKEFKEETKAE